MAKVICGFIPGKSNSAFASTHRSLGKTQEKQIPTVQIGMSYIHRPRWLRLRDIDDVGRTTSSVVYDVRA